MTYLAFFYQIKITQSKSWGINNLKQLLVCFAELYWRRIEEGDSSQEVKLTRLLQQMEISEGFKKMIEKNLK